MKNKYSWLLLLMMLGACSKASSPEVSAVKVSGVIAEMESHGEIPVLDRSATLGGVDADNNGIRDDIDKLIVAQHKSEEETKAMQQLAKAIQIELTSKLTNRAEIQLSGERVGKAIDCLGDKTGKDFDRVFHLILNSSINTRARKLEEDRTDQLASGMVFHSYGSEACE